MLQDKYDIFSGLKSTVQNCGLAMQEMKWLLLVKKHQPFILAFSEANYMLHFSLVYSCFHTAVAGTWKGGRKGGKEGRREDPNRLGMVP